MYRLCALLVLVASATAININNRIFNGQPANIRNHPYQVSLQESTKYHFCGGALIKTNYVLSAAHCVATYPYQEKYVQAGSSDALEGGTILMVKRFVLHPKYEMAVQDYDAAVLTLIQPFYLHAAISTIDLVPLGKKPKVGDILTVTGWGATKVGENDFSRKLMAVQIPVVDMGKCYVYYTERKMALTDRMFCAGGGSVGPSTGDSGGPAVNTKRQLVGIVSCGKPGDPAVFTDIAHSDVRTFIDVNTR